MTQNIERYNPSMEYRCLPYAIRLGFEQRLGNEIADGNDYRRFAAEIPLEQHVVNLLGADAMTRGTKVIEKWIHAKGRQATLHKLHTIITDLKMTALCEYLEKYMEEPMAD